MGKIYILVMGRHMYQSKGYTLIEMLFVVTIITIISFLGFTYKEIEINDEIIIRDIIQFINNSKTIAMSKKTTVYITINNNHITRNYDDNSDKLILKKGYFTKNYKFQYNSNGNIKTAKTFSYKTKLYRYDFIMQVGSGTFYVQKKRINIT